MDKTTREAIAAEILAASSADETEVLIVHETSALTRFTHENVHQNVASDVVTIHVRVIVDKRCGIASTSMHDTQSLHRVVERAVAVAAFSPRDEEWPGLPTPQTAAPASAHAYVEATAQADAERRATAVDAMFGVSERAKLWCAGFVANGATGVTVANSHGVLLSFDGTQALATIKENASDATGYAECATPNIAQINARAVAEIAARKALETRTPRAVEPGAWTVVLEPVAFAELLSYFTGNFSAQAIEEGTSFLDWEALGKPCVDASITMRDDWTHPLAPGMPFDFEGTPRERPVLIDGGRAVHAISDSRWAARLQRANTGHALAAASGEGPQPLNIVIDPGTQSLDDLIAGTERGLLISRFWYIRPVDERQTIVTGMTRDGTYLIENGKLAGGVRNLRFNQSILAALGKVILANTQVRSTGLNYTMVVPAVKIAAFNFSSTTSF